MDLRTHGLTNYGHKNSRIHGRMDARTYELTNLGTLRTLRTLRTDALRTYGPTNPRTNGLTNL